MFKMKLTIIIAVVALAEKRHHSGKINLREQAIRNYKPIRTLEHEKLIGKVRGEWSYV